MSSRKIVTMAGIGQVTLTKRRGSKNIRLSYSSDGEIRVSLPYMVPYEAGLAFIRSKVDWLDKHRPKPAAQINEGSRIGKAHRIMFTISIIASSPRVRVANNKIKVILPKDMNSNDSVAQEAAKRGALKALRHEADQLLPQRLDQLAKKHGFTYRSVVTKRLVSRWGSCSQNHDIVLNVFLMQLPWQLIDYVIVHELVHTEHLNHSSGFWQRFEQIMPNARWLRKELKSYPTSVQPS